MAPTCSALNLSDASKCNVEASSTDGLFCRFHSKQCYGLYRGYKIRNAKLDGLNASPPSYLASSKSTLRNEDFDAVEDEAEVLYKQRKWFSWVRERQDEDEAAREKESEMVKKEAKLFRRHWREVEARVREKRRIEDAQRQELALEEAYRERQAQRSDEEEEGDEAWDPIEDSVEEEKGAFVDMMRRLLWLELSVPVSTGPDASDGDQESTAETAKGPTATMGGVVEDNTPVSSGNDDQGTVKVEVNEDRDEMRSRLTKGVRFRPGAGVRGEMVAGTIESPVATMGKIPEIPADGVETLLDDVAEIKNYLFCRLLLSQAAVLPAALKAGSVEAFLADEQVKPADLRDLCLRIEKPSLQEVRDACADFFRGDDEEGDEQDVTDSEDEGEDPDTKGLMRLKHEHVPDTWRSKHEQAVDERKAGMRAMADIDSTMVDFGDVSAESGEFKTRKVRVKVCGKTIWNYPSDKSMPRGGWLHYSIIAKGSRLFDAIELCRNWNEFWNLNVLAIFRYFPSPHWEQWSGDRLRQQLLQLGFIPYLQFDAAETYTVRQKSGSRGQGQRVHASVEYKNIIAAHIKRNDPVSRRFVQYLSMQTGDVVILVRDARTGKILVNPPEEHCWLVRDKAGTRRAARTEWTVRKSVDENLFEQISGKKMRDWQFGFTKYYDVIAWDMQPGQPFSILYGTIQEALMKANRVCEGTDMYASMAPVLKTLTQERESGRTRDAKEREETLWEVLQHQGSRLLFAAGQDERKEQVGSRGSVVQDEFMTTAPPNWFYSDIDAAEDEVLFPDELERHGPNWKRFILGLESDDDEDDYEDDKLTVQLELEGRMGERRSTHRPVLTEGREGKGEAESISRELALREGDCACSSCKGGEHEFCEEWDDDSEDEEGALGELDEHDEETLRLLTQMDILIPGVPHEEDEDPEKAFWIHMDREKVKVFKKQWHEAVTNGEEKARYQALTSLTAALTPKEVRGRGLANAEITYLLSSLVWLQVHLREHRLVYGDMVKALAMTSIFFTTDLSGRELSEALAETRAQLADTARAGRLKPYDRPFQSNSAVSKDFWKEVDEFYKARKQDGASYSRDWDMVVRPLVAHWFKSGVVAPAHLPYPPGTAVVKTEPGNKSAVYSDYRSYRDEWPNQMRYNKITNPNSIDILRFARQWHQQDRPESRYALLRIWTHSHFYPLMLGWDNRAMSSFSDTVGRSWEWRFVTKDMPGSEWSIQKGVEMRVERFKKQFGKQVVVKRDMLLVMGKDEEDLKRLVLGVIFAVQTSPWRMEVDLWKSFVNVDLAFLEGLVSVWLE
ncbi:hypothetical protein LTR37_000454 [Vermiconidia calcicola]|uniref:Uncharacterized protein n=1 Tax=Vermiconidia calcicola TaxID=1690605 RepID=A0ACC3NYK6_9PEZI|nr:hypothetical protein LTR37_000454 [Vermiconidia calcicola]